MVARSEPEEFICADKNEPSLEQPQAASLTSPHDCLIELRRIQYTKRPLHLKRITKGEFKLKHLPKLLQRGAPVSESPLFLD